MCFIWGAGLEPSVYTIYGVSRARGGAGARRASLRASLGGSSMV